ncbi:peptidase M48 [Halobacteriales archaeon QS_4_69_31]|nr:MAG: peptidase M48 [Halobacteriales archaeon QS_4_69_31]
MVSLVAVGLVALLVGTEAFFTALSVLNLRHEEATVRAEREWVQSELGIEDTDELLDYNRATTGLSLLRQWVTLGALVVVLFSGLFADAVSAVEATGWPLAARSAVFFGGLVVAKQLFDVPFDLVNTFVVEEIFGFNEQSLGLWARDAVLGTVVGLAVTVPLLTAVVWFVDNVAYWPVAAWLLFVGFVLAMQVLKPRVIDPLFYDFTKIDEGELREAVDEVFERAGFACEQVYEMDYSSRSSHSSAYFVGFGRTKRVVLFDTLIEDMSVPEVQSVLAHELAHWKNGHIWKFIGLAAVRFGVVFAVLGYLVGADWLYAPFAVPATAYVGLALAFLWVLPFQRLTSPLDNFLSLKYEREADAFAAETVDGETMADALANLAAENLASLFPHPWYETFHYDHPPIPERMRRVREIGTGGEPADESGPQPAD